jgi:hypothetical protein
MKKQLNRYYTLLLLALIFAAPGITAYFFYQHPSWLGSSRTNKGSLLNPPIRMDSFPGTAKWRVVFLNTGVCEQECLHQLETLARVRLALGRKLYQVDEWLLLDGQSSSTVTNYEALLQDHDIHTTKLSTHDRPLLKSLAHAKIFIVNPDNYLILSYQVGVNPDDVYKDLKLLLNSIANKSG